jgi:hypothetical protein
MQPPAGVPDGVLQPFATDNPYLQRLFGHEAYGVVPDGCGELLRRLQTAAPDEQLVTALRVRHGIAESGILMVTTHWLRYVKQGRIFTAIANDEFWPLDGSFTLEANLGSSPLFRTAEGHQFQVLPAIPFVSRRQAKAFLEVYKLTALATAHAQAEFGERSSQSSEAPRQSTGTVDQIRELAALRQAGALSEAEFEKAKARVLAE